MDLISIIDNNDDCLFDIVQRLQNFEIGILPTDTVYGLIGISNSLKVKNRIYEIKQRSLAKQLVLQVSKSYDLKKITANIPNSAKKLISSFWPGALTLIFEASPDFIEKYNWEIETVAVRIPNHVFLLKILEQLNEPLFVTSSNISGEELVNDSEILKQQFSKLIDFFLFDNHEYGIIPSTIVEIVGEEINILREGIIKKNQIMEVLAKNDK